MDNKIYKKIRIKKGDKILTGIQVKKKTKLIFCKKFLNKLKRTNSNTSSSSNNSVSSTDIDLDCNSIEDIEIDIIN